MPLRDPSEVQWDNPVNPSRGPFALGEKGGGAARAKNPQNRYNPVRHPALLVAALLVTSAAVAQTAPPPPAPPPPVPAPPAPEPTGGVELEWAPWSLTPPERFAACGPDAEAVLAARRAVQEARDAVALGPPLPDPPRSVRVGAPLYADPQRSQALPVTADSGTVALSQAVAVKEEVAFEGEYASGGSRFRVYLDPADTDDPTASDRRAAAALALRRATSEAQRGVERAEAAATECRETEAWAWRRGKGEAEGYALTRAGSDVVLREGTELYDPRVADVGRGGELWASALTDDEAFAVVVHPASSSVGFVPTVELDDLRYVLAVLRPKMAAEAAAAAVREQELFAETPDLRITKLVAISNYSLSGVRFEFYNLRAGKTLRYLHLTARPYNRVGDAISRRQGGGAETVTLVGPSEPSTSTVYSAEFDDIWLTDLVSCVRLTSVHAKYMDGTERTWRNSVDTLFEDPDYWNRCP